MDVHLIVIQQTVECQTVTRSDGRAPRALQSRQRGRDLRRQHNRGAHRCYFVSVAAAAPNAPQKGKRVKGATAASSCNRVS